jgi:hypothetical protein
MPSTISRKGSALALDTQQGTSRLGGRRLGNRRLSTETKHASKTTELYLYIAAVIGILIASALIGADDDAGRGDAFGDYFTAHDAWRLIAFLTIGYMIARGLAKSGSREPYWEDGSNEERGDR